ncbi:MAG: YjbQ family protein [Acidimicrobiia bacterium]|nr:YjbQ family protein [Acidimicrobiia bacterium]MYB43474.1 YjbQ family protein [Acidimicrobiia bacterium]MYC85369.1 YjbQ family protein [Acidimicrobiia bacterium]
MALATEVFQVRTGAEPAVVDIGYRLATFVRGRGDGLLSVFVPHSTAGLAIMEVGARSDRDLLAYLRDGMSPDRYRWEHRHGAPGHGADHIIPAFISPSLMIPVRGGAPTLGTWQTVVLVDTNVDNPVRDVRLSFLAA